MIGHNQIEGSLDPIKSLPIWFNNMLGMYVPASSHIHSALRTSVVSCCSDVMYNLLEGKVPPNVVDAKVEGYVA
jgi:hypothetical protein